MGRCFSSGTGNPVAAERPLVLGLNAAYHETAAAIIRGPEVIFAAEEERYSREKHGKPACITNPDQLPWGAIRDCLRAADCRTLSDVDAVAYSLAPGRRLAMIGSDPYPIGDGVGFGTQWGERTFDIRVRNVPEILSAAAGLSPRKKGTVPICRNGPEGASHKWGLSPFSGGFHFVPHHLAHAACAWYASGFPSAAVLVVDGIGESATTWLGRGGPAGLEMIEEIAYPHSIGMLWERVAEYLGFGEYGAAKVMGLAAFGDPQRFAQAIDRLFPVRPEKGTGAFCRNDPPPFSVNLDLARFRAGDVAGLESLFGRRRQPDESPTEPRFADVAAGLQRRTEEALLALVRRLHCATGESRLAYSGGVALNCVANSRLERDGPFDAIHVYAAPHDAGTAIGAALEAARRIAEGKKGTGTFCAKHPEGRSGKRRLSPFSTAARPPLTPLLGGESDHETIDAALARWGFSAATVAGPESRAASLLADGQIVAWFRGRMEFGPRALGNRSLLADPRTLEIRECLNRHIKHRESFRPFAAAVLEEQAEQWFEIPADRQGAKTSRDLMLLAYRVRPDASAKIPAVVHRDGTCRIQTVSRERQPHLHRLISAFFELTGVPLVLNTSFNEQEPLVRTPDDALATFVRTDIDALFLDDRLVLRGG